MDIKWFEKYEKTLVALEISWKLILGTRPKFYISFNFRLRLHLKTARKDLESFQLIKLINKNSSPCLCQKK